MNLYPLSMIFLVAMVPIAVLSQNISNSLFSSDIAVHAIQIKAYWTQVSVSSTGQFVYAVAQRNSVYASYDYGVTLKPVFGDSWGDVWNAVVTNPSGQYVYAANDDNPIIYKSDDYGKSWVELPDSYTTEDHTFYPYTTIAVSENGQYVYGGSSPGSTIRYSYDYGITWKKSTVYPKNGGFYSVTCSPDGQYVYAVSKESIYISSDYSATYQEVYSVTPGNVFFSGISATNSGNVVVATLRGYTTDNDGFVLKSTEYGKAGTWKPLTASSNHWHFSAVDIADETGEVYITESVGTLDMTTLNSTLLNVFYNAASSWISVSSTSKGLQGGYVFVADFNGLIYRYNYVTN